MAHVDQKDAPRSSADNVESQSLDHKDTQHSSQRMTALIKAVTLTTSQPGVAPKRYAQKAKRDLSATDRPLSVPALIDAVRMAHVDQKDAPRSSADNVESQSLDRKDTQHSSQRMTALIKAVTLTTSQPGVAP